MREIQKYEKELEKIVREDKKSWTRLYKIMKDIEEKELYKEENLKSFTAWVKSFCLKNKIHESILWSKKKAGKMYESYIQIKEKSGVEVTPLSDVNISPDSLVLIDKIAKNNDDLKVELTEKALEGEMTRNDLRLAYRQARKVSQKDNKDDDNSSPAKSNNTQHWDVMEISNPKETVAAVNIVTALSDPNWLGVEYSKKHFGGAYEQPKYKTLGEFPVFTATSLKSRRIDILAAENIRTTDYHSLNLHGIEIKVCESDLKRDTKYTEYAEFVDFLWLAIPENLINVAEELIPPSVGILVYKKNIEAMTVHKEAEKLQPLRKADSLTTLSIRLI